MVFKFVYNLLNIILLVIKNIKMFSKKIDRFLKIVIDKKIFNLANIIKNQYFNKLVKYFSKKFEICNN